MCECGFNLSLLPMGAVLLSNDDSQRILEANEAFLRLIRAPVAPDCYLSLVHPDDIKAFLGGVAVYRLIVRDGGVVWVCDTRSTVSRATFHALADITDVSQSLESLRHDSQRDKILINLMSEITFELDLASDVLTLSRNCARRFDGGDVIESARAALSDAPRVYPDDKRMFLRFLNDALHACDYSSVEVRIMDFSGRYVWFRIRAKSQLDSAGNAVRVLGVISDIDDERSTIDKLRRKAERDTLTGLLNKQETRIQITNCLESHASGEQGAVYVCDVDNFKGVNDSCGHKFGDESLVKLSNVIKKFTRSSDVSGRIGGDEFMIYMRGVPSSAFVKRRAQQIIDAYSASFDITPRPSVSIGAAISPRHGTDFDTLYSKADSALYAAKKRGKNRAEIYDSDMDTGELSPE